MATLRGEPVDRPAVNFYEVGGVGADPNSPDPFNIYNDPSWKPLLDLAEKQTDLIRMVGPQIKSSSDSGPSDNFSSESYMDNSSLYTRTRVEAAGRTLTTLSRRDPHVATVWTIEHLLKDTDDLKAYLSLPDGGSTCEVDVSNLLEAEKEVSDKGIVMVDIADPICHAASLFSMQDYTVTAFTEPKLFHALLERIARGIYPVVEQVAKEFPGRLWRVVGPEYATEPYLPPRLFEEYVVRYTQPIVQSIKKYGGYPRIHCHGRIKSALPYFVQMGATGTDPIEPPPQGDVELDYVRREYGRDLALFGNIEASDIENMDPAEFEKVVAKTLRDGTAGEGKGFVLMPSSCPYGRKITAQTMANYETMVRLTTSFAG